MRIFLTLSLSLTLTLPSLDLAGIVLSALRPFFVSVLSSGLSPVEGTANQGPAQIETRHKSFARKTMQRK